MYGVDNYDTVNLVGFNRLGRMYAGFFVAAPCGDDTIICYGILFTTTSICEIVYLYVYILYTYIYLNACIVYACVKQSVGKSV